MQNAQPRSRPSALRLGAHMSIAGGLPRAVDRARSVDASALQVFVKSARQWVPKPLDPAEAKEFRESLESAGLRESTLAHASYLINLASPDHDLFERSIEAFAAEVERCRQLGIPYAVLHPGSHMGSGEEAGLDRVAAALDRVLRGRRGVMVLLETTAGQGTNLGHRFEHLGHILRRARSRKKLGVCFDTCHALAAGYDFRDPRSFRETFRSFDAAVGIEHLKAFHLNDSRHALGSRKDRHEHIGQGEVGLEAFRLLLNDRRFRALPMVLETPKSANLAEDRRNLDVLRGLTAHPVRTPARAAKR